jgi:hypothetical protein
MTLEKPDSTIPSNAIILPLANQAPYVDKSMYFKYRGTKIIPLIITIIEFAELNI